MTRPGLLVVCLSTLVLLAGCAGVPGGEGTADESAEEFVVTVTEVVDGDTIDVRFENGTTDRVRLLGVDTPEVHTDTSPGEFAGVPETAAGRDCLRDWGQRASSYASETLHGETVTIRFDENANRRGGYGRLLAYVLVDDQNFNRQLVSDGYARVFSGSFTQFDQFVEHESQAQSNTTGLWECRGG